ncbi:MULTISPECIES: anti-sigma regulatory factor [unclassified Nodularia (in: cyanobacteria)]|uniref:ATP-binding protein n=1 Tax=unclassified Nodularia (in: cyanobacteria) TaxID=2656917 RepID=UPI001882432A|nr:MULTISPECIES: anti-sigma regulatory factor [unclassified Nodularia (in: cyanobacteria)]MBE9200950.1 anti-sigma regulatory factor [Nodularia sp. LEGE 06071]MCC2692464.1 anti-sigma regulatory factor [Nodularia sp. LEGE 04288]
MNKKIHLKVKTDLNDTEKVLSWFEQINQPPLPDQNVWWKCQTLLIEGFTNIVEHAHKNLPVEIPIELEVVRLSEHIEIRIWSVGEAFDLEQQLQITPELTDNFQDRGRGLKIISSIAEEFSYLPTDDQRNCLFFKIKY